MTRLGLQRSLAALVFAMLAGGALALVVWRQPMPPGGHAVFITTIAALCLLSGDRRDRRRLLVMAAVGFAAELFGVATGRLFGSYRYSGLLGPQIGGVPIVMACSWIVVYAYVRQKVSRLPTSTALKILIASAWMVSIDFVIDPVAVNVLGLWQWIGGGEHYGVPIWNSAGWFTVSVVMFTIDRLAFAHVDVDDRWTSRAVFGLLLFLCVVSFRYGLVVSGACGLGLCVLHMVIRSSLRRLSAPASLPPLGDSPAASY